MGVEDQRASVVFLETRERELAEALAGRARILARVTPAVPRPALGGVVGDPAGRPLAICGRHSTSVYRPSRMTPRRFVSDSGEDLRAARCLKE